MDMRIIGGKYRGRRIHPPKGIEARPTTDFAKEGVFNILQHSVPLEGIRVLDLFSGTGNIALEFLSRGAEEVISVDHDRELYTHMLGMARGLNEARWHIVRSDVFTYLNGAAVAPTIGTSTGGFDIIFADPPFGLDGIERLPILVRERQLLLNDGLLIVEHPKNVDMSADPWFQRHRPYGNVHFSFFTPTPQAP